MSNLSHLSFGKDGKPYGDFVKYGVSNVSEAIQTLKDIHEENNSGAELSMTTIMIFARTFYYLTESHVNKGKKGKVMNWDGIFDKSKIRTWLKAHYTSKTSCPFTNKESLTNNLGELGRSGADKDLSWRAFDTYLPKLLESIANYQKRKNRYGHKHPAINAYIQSIETDALQIQARLRLKSDTQEFDEAA